MAMHKLKPNISKLTKQNVLKFSVATAKTTTVVQQNTQTRLSELKATQSAKQNEFITATSGTLS